MSTPTSMLSLASTVDADTEWCVTEQQMLIFFKFFCRMRSCHLGQKSGHRQNRQVTRQLSSGLDPRRRQLQLLRVQVLGQELQRRSPVRVPVRRPLLRAAHGRLSAQVRVLRGPGKVPVPIKLRYYTFWTLVSQGT